MTNSCQLLILQPFAHDAKVGNATTARRLATGLKRFGHQTSFLQIPKDLRPDADGTWEFPPEFTAAAADADLILALHAVHSAPAAAALSAASSTPFIVLFTGTDLNGQPPIWAIQATQQATTCVALAPSSQRRAKDIYGLKSVQLIPQAASPLPEPRGGARLPEQAPKLEAGDFLVVVPAGIRPVKAPRRALKALRRSAAKFPNLKLWFAGPELDSTEATALREELKAAPWAQWLGALSPTELAAVFRRANLVVSTSRSEGGAPNALLEAALFGRPVAASNIAAHRYYPGPNFLFREDGDLRNRVEQCMEDPQEVAMEARKLQELTRTRFDATREAVTWDRLICNLLKLT